MCIRLAVFWSSSSSSFCRLSTSAGIVQFWCVVAYNAFYISNTTSFTAGHFEIYTYIYSQMPFHFTRIKNIHTDISSYIGFMVNEMEWWEVTINANQVAIFKIIMTQPKTYNIYKLTNIAKRKWKRIGTHAKHVRMHCPTTTTTMYYVSVYLRFLMRITNVSGTNTTIISSTNNITHPFESGLSATTTKIK